MGKYQPDLHAVAFSEDSRRKPLSSYLFNFQFLTKKMVHMIRNVVLDGKFCLLEVVLYWQECNKQPVTICVVLNTDKVHACRGSFFLLPVSTPQMGGASRLSEWPVASQDFVSCGNYCHVYGVTKDGVWIGNWICWILFSYGATAPIWALAYLHETLRFTSVF
jgi:hypothetical protein